MLCSSQELGDAAIGAAICAALQHDFMIISSWRMSSRKREKNMKRKTVIIKKYGNRRLYDATHSRYINQNEVAQMVREGLDLQVVDAVTGEDLTRLVLTQIIVENAKEPDSAFPLDILRQMVAASGRVTQETTLKYMKTVLDMYQNAYRAIAPPVSPFEFMQTATALQAAPVAHHPTSDAAEKAREMRSTGEKGTEGDEVGELKRRLAELESLVSKRRTEKPRKRKTTSRRKG
jgi:polyhydroxyalkanoate synthesis repressor PhaR